MSIAQTMRAVVLTGHGGLDRLEYHDDWPTPQPGPGEVLVRVGACGLNNTDINTRTAWYSRSVTEGMNESGGQRGFAAADPASGGWAATPIAFPRIQGADVAGTVAAVGAGVEAGRVGERVLLDPWLLADGDWLDVPRARYLGSECDGGFAEYTTIRAANAIAIDSPLADTELATLPCAATTAENLALRAAPRPGETVVVNGASGGVGSAALQLCRLRGARVVAIASAAKTETLLALGADRVVDRDEADLGAAIRAAAGGPVDVALDVVGGSSFMPLIGALRHGGRCASAGSVAGPLVEFDLRELVYRDLQLCGATIVPPGTMRRLVRLIERGQLAPLPAQSFPLAELHAAQETFMARRHVGKLVVTP